MNQGSARSNAAAVENWAMHLGSLFATWIRNQPRLVAEAEVNLRHLQSPRDASWHLRGFYVNEGTMVDHLRSVGAAAHVEYSLDAIAAEIQNLPNNPDQNTHGIRSIRPESWILYFATRMLGDMVDRDILEPPIFFAKEGLIVREFMAQHFGDQGVLLFRRVFWHNAINLAADYDRIADGNYSSDDEDRVMAGAILAGGDLWQADVDPDLGMESNYANRYEQLRHASKVEAKNAAVRQRNAKHRREEELRRGPIPPDMQRMLQEAEAKAQAWKRARLQAAARRKARAAAKPPTARKPAQKTAPKPKKKTARTRVTRRKPTHAKTHL